MTLTPSLRAARTPRFAKTLLFRLSALFLAFLGVCLGGYFLWIQATVFSPYATNDEKDWFEDRADRELDTLTATLAAVDSDPAAAGRALSEFGEHVTRFGVELMVFDPQGAAVAGSSGDSLLQAVPKVDVVLLSAMAAKDWDYASYPDKSNVDAFENRIFDVNVIGAPGSPRGFLAASYRPIEIDASELEAHGGLLVTQQRLVKVLAGMLVLASVGALLLMGWTSRRISRLSAAMEAFTGGNLKRRVIDGGGSDEIDDLGRHFNHMAGHIETMVDSLRQKERFQRQLIANVSHDLRTPMASLRGHVESLRLRFGQLDNTQRERALDTISGNLEHLDRLVERMLVLSRLDAGQAAIQPEEFSIVELADSVIRRCEHLALPGDITLELDAQPRLPLVSADPLQVALVLQNLIENGIKFNCPQGRVTVALAHADGDRVSLSVTDTGRGIDASDIPHIFERFFTGDASRTRLDGAPAHLKYSSGLGLAIAAKIVAAHGDELKVTSRPGEGAAFRFHLAVAKDQGLAAMAAEG